MGRARRTTAGADAVVLRATPPTCTPPSNADMACRNFSYFDAVLAPIVDALNDVLRDGQPTWLSLQGEMGATGTLPGRHRLCSPHFFHSPVCLPPLQRLAVFFFPWEWEEVAEEVRERLRPALRTSTNLGLGINNSKLCG